MARPQHLPLGEKAGRKNWTFFHLNVLRKKAEDFFYFEVLIYSSLLTTLPTQPRHPHNQIKSMSQNLPSAFWRIQNRNFLIPYIYMLVHDWLTLLLLFTGTSLFGWSKRERLGIDAKVAGLEEDMRQNRSQWNSMWLKPWSLQILIN